MTDEEINAMTALADAAIKNDGWSHVHYVEVMRRFQNSFKPTAIKGLIERLKQAESDSDQYSSLLAQIRDMIGAWPPSDISDGYAMGHPEGVVTLVKAYMDKMQAERDEAYRALVCLVDHDLRDPKWDVYCEAMEKARAFVEDEE